jgi:hypothetical protein
MKEGWNSDKYWILFNKEEIPIITRRYNIEKFIKGYKIIGLMNWEDFILEDKNGKHYLMPTIPIDLKHIKAIEYSEITEFKEARKYKGKIKWYIKPIIFLGNPDDKKNISWINLEEHVKMVKLWNDKYLESSEK